MKKKKLPIGISDFKDIITKDYYYIDKTLLIEELLDKGAGVTLITRPRRFGKTLNMSTLKYFFDIENSEENRKLFDGLNISKTEYMEHQGKYPVIFFTMKDITGITYEEMFTRFKEVMRTLFDEYEALRDKLNESDLMQFDKIWLVKADANYSLGIQFLSKILYKHYGVKPVLLIDEYDSPMINANENGYYNEAKSLLGTFYGSALKDGICSFAVVSGILRIAKESIFSSLNNLKVSTILTGDYNYFGMTETEVEEILRYYDLQTTLEDTKKWYNGYLFGDLRVYNPWSILYHCSSRKLEAFWINTSGNLLIKEILRYADKEIFNTFHTLLKNGSVKTTLQENMVFGMKYSDSTLLYLMFSAGYLTIDRKGEEKHQYYLTIPNYEVKEYFQDTFMEIVSPKNYGKFWDLITALRDGNITGIDSVEELLQMMFEASMSYMDGSSEEKFYHNLILGMIMCMDKYFYPLSNREAGYGRYDIALEPKDPLGIGYIFEFKVANKLEEMDGLGSEALEQIENKRYRTDMENRGVKDIKEIAMVFYKKSLKFYWK
ncbi:MAG: AAA family ATPase [Fusobacteriaceae bacterium]